MLQTLKSYFAYKDASVLVTPSFDNMLVFDELFVNQVVFKEQYTYFREKKTNSTLERFANRKATDTATEIKWRLSVAFMVTFEISGLLCIGAFKSIMRVLLI